ncbi:MAG: hypothetical protein SVZ03_07560 [Spirochaetota bacterium]|nr:hypothetical protein [Spirochaetota bacterium]
MNLWIFYSRLRAHAFELGRRSELLTTLTDVNHLYAQALALRMEEAHNERATVWKDLATRLLRGYTDWNRRASALTGSIHWDAIISILYPIHNKKTPLILHKV